MAASTSQRDSSHATPANTAVYAGGAMDEASEEKKPDTNQINLKVVTQDGNEIFFKVGARPRRWHCGWVPCSHTGVGVL